MRSQRPWVLAELAMATTSEVSQTCFIPFYLFIYMVSLVFNFYSVVFVSAILQLESAMIIYIYPFGLEPLSPSPPHPSRSSQSTRLGSQTFECDLASHAASSIAKNTQVTRLE